MSEDAAIRAKRALDTLVRVYRMPRKLIAAKANVSPITVSRLARGDVAASTRLAEILEEQVRQAAIAQAVSAEKFAEITISMPDDAKITNEGNFFGHLITALLDPRVAASLPKVDEKMENEINSLLRHIGERLDEANERADRLLRSLSMTQ